MGSSEFLCLPVFVQLISSDVFVLVRSRSLVRFPAWPSSVQDYELAMLVVKRCDFRIYLGGVPAE